MLRLTKRNCWILAASLVSMLMLWQAHRLNAQVMPAPAANVDVDALLAQADASNSNAQWDDAIAKYTQALQLQPGNALVLAARGFAWANKGSYDQALADYNASLAIDPNQANILVNRACMYLAKNDVESASRDASTALGMNWNNPSVHNLLGDIAFYKHDYRGAVTAYSDAIIQETPTDGAYTDFFGQTHNLSNYYADRANSYSMLGDVDSALNDCRMSLQFNATNAHAWNIEALVLTRKGDIAGAINAYSSGTICAPSSPENFNGLAWLQATCTDGRFRDGKAALQNALRAAELSDYKDGGILDTLAAAYAETGDFDNAVTWEYGAIDLETNADDKAALLKHLQLYQNHQPYRDVGGTGN